jgi:hypothetical protein
MLFADHAASCLRNSLSLQTPQKLRIPSSHNPLVIVSFQSHLYGIRLEVKTGRSRHAELYLGAESFQQAVLSTRVAVGDQPVIVCDEQ